MIKEKEKEVLKHEASLYYNYNTIKLHTCQNSFRLLCKSFRLLDLATSPTLSNIYVGDFCENSQQFKT